MGEQVNWIREKLETPGALELSKDQKKLLMARFPPPFQLILIKETY